MVICHMKIPIYIFFQEETLEGLNSKLRAESDKLQETGSKMNKNITDLKRWQDLVSVVVRVLYTCCLRVFHVLLVCLFTCF